MKKSLLLVVFSLLLMPVEGNAQKWLKKLESVAKTVDQVSNALAPSTASTTATTGSDESSSTAAVGVIQQGGTKIVTNHPDLKIKITRCVVNGRTCVIDMVFTNVGDRDLNEVFFYSGYNGTTTAFDDEGNQYSKNILFGIASKGVEASVNVLLPSNVPLKMRMQIDDVPESATQFLRINLNIYCSQLNLRDKPITITNVPITRDGDE